MQLPNKIMPKHQIKKNQTKDNTQNHQYFQPLLYHHL